MFFVAALFAALVSSLAGGHVHFHIPSDTTGGPIT
jgi:hypothetical protein